MQDVNTKHSNQMVDFTRDYDEEAKAVLRQVEQNLQNGRKQIVWTVLQPAKILASNSNVSANRVKWGSLVGTAIPCISWVMIDKFLLHEMISKEMPLTYINTLIIFIVLGVLQWIFMPKLINQQMNRAQHTVIYVHLDLMRQMVSVMSPLQRGATIAPFHSQSLLHKWIKLLAFRLPETENVKYSALRDKVQRQITERCGFEFKREK
ncbi:hypothetical protein [Kingella kingae]|uniref:hypothetical protein n=1 Tax=Kingella kingae TaxID=504 RepID=UPI00041C7C93|nr:hypothetical protein [Kingella kingae]MDK4530448.1 hypothetical protein [Kingella kingae]MDK4580021.1 hypothetical protein [Kingella kingae]